jgi:MFS family permease
LRDEAFALSSAAPRYRMPLLRALRHRDFRILWFGALLSFFGGQIQTVAQSYWVYDVTGSKGQLAMVTFAWSLPVMLFAPFAGVVADRFDRRIVLVTCVSILAASAGVMALLMWHNMLQYWHVITAASLGGLVQTVEAPARQSVVRTVVGEEDLPAAIPAQAMTFNLARIMGPAVGGILLKEAGVFPCFVINAVSFSFLILSVLMIRASLKPKAIEAGSIGDLVMEGMRFTFRSRPLRILFIMEAATSTFGVFYISLLAAFVRTQLGLDQVGLGNAHSSIGLGAITGLVFLSFVADKPIKTLVARTAMTMVGIGILALGFVRSPALAFPLLGLIGASTIMQFNTTNTLFQLMSPEALRGRVIAMHLWAISGVAPFGIFAFGWLAEFRSLSVALWTGGSLLILVSIWAWTQARHVPEMQKLAA